ncbi:accessory Sec system protein Asp1 [Streptococcus iniae]|uniref:accessory Sec system protein Asp1 n=1 Tax=Streptococcus iniae TaxID=1346 RepID=UPI000334800B|nr:accessory Sec system protein Asp1 [Streptococcus iniae]AGM98252.1 Gap1 [Streptococcus iniae SF1]APD31353.1 accessory Sec system protein Asp1 [Streptococcus iniae]AYB02287.1 accessory Sec system protein Asp1 [Streptococcus iniae]AYB04154.1 accessory Sec system protein Asp1 [Streptococcus iniae]OAS98333.1 accessory Sec system protein Asp1 [Streptococcus iniae]
MFYFIPSWYNDNRKWYDNTPLWFRVFERMTFDDTINQLKMFKHAKETSQILLLNYQPLFRYFLHKQDLLGEDYWSFFDDIQNISKQNASPISFKSLNWPKETQFLYSPFAIVAKHAGKQIGIIHFAENGNLFYIDFQIDGTNDKRYIFDDRGFLSSILYYDKSGEELYQDYLNENGLWQVREHFNDDRKYLEINTNADKEFQESFYSSWENLILERLTAYKAKQITKDDTIIIASHPQHNDLVNTVFDQEKKVYSFFGERQSLSDTAAIQPLIASSSLLVTASEKDELALKTTMETLSMTSKKMTRISPFDTRLRLGHSQTIRELILYFYIDGLSRVELEKVLRMLMAMMDQNLDIALSIVTFNRDLSLKELEKWVTAKLQDHYQPEHFFEKTADDAENQLDEDVELELKRITFNCFTNENQIIKALDRTRLVIDLGQIPDQYTQIASISAGVPQINRVKTDYVNHLENGWLLQDLEALPEAIHYYFDGLANWNASLVYAIQKMADYTGGNILKQWKDLLEKD